MIRVEVRARQDDLFDIWVVAANGEVLLNSSQGYERAVDAERVARVLFGSRMESLKDGSGVEMVSEPIALRVTYRDGKTHTEQIR